MKRIGAGLSGLLLLLPGMALAVEKEHAPGIVNLDITLLLQAINFLILAVILYKFLFKPLTSFMEKRAEGIRESLEEAKKAREEVARARAEHEESLRTTQREAVAFRDRMEREIAEERQRLMHQAREEAQRLLSQAAVEIDQEVKRAKAELKAEAVHLSLMAAEQLLQRNLQGEDHRRFVERYIEEMGRSH